MLAPIFVLWLAVAGLPAAKTATTAVEINSAPVPVLMRLPGIGPKRAAAIVKARERRPFRSVYELLRIRGIGRKRLARLLPLIRVDTRKRRRPSRKAHPSPGGT